MAGGEESVANPDENAEEYDAETDTPSYEFLFHREKRLKLHRFQFIGQFGFFIRHMHSFRYARRA
jgi:hypothetical protein